MVDKATLDPDDLDFEDPLAKEAYQELEADKDKTPMDKALEEKKPEEKPAEPEPEEEKPAEPETEEEETEEEPEESKEEESPEETQEEESEEKSEEKPEEDVIREIAVAESLTIDEAKERYEGRKSILEKYENDPVKMAKALQSTQSAFDKTRVENEELKKQPDVGNFEAEIESARAKVPTYVQNNQDKLIEQYKNKYPHKSEKMETEEIIEEVTAIVTANFQTYANNKLAEVKTQASAKRHELIEGISEQDREFIPEVKAILNETPDIQVMSKSFDIKDLIYHARGRKYTPEYIEQIKQEAIKKGKEDPKIIGEKVSSPQGGKKKETKKPTGELNTAQTERAVEMFPDMELKQAVEDYKDLFKDELKENPNFIG